MEQAQVITGMYFPSAGVRVLVPLFTSAFMEEASGVPMFHLSDYNIGASVGGVPASAFSLLDPANGQPLFPAREVLRNTFAVAHVMFSQDPDTVFFNNIRSDLPLFVRDMARRPIMRHVLQYLESHPPERAASRYDNGLLKVSLQRNFGTRLMNQSDKSNFVLSFDMDDEAPAIFGHIHPDLFSHDGIPTTISPVRAGKSAEGVIPLHGNVSFTDGILAATAIPGFIGYQCVDSLKKHFMDAGAFGNGTVASVVEDMHDMAVNMQRRAQSSLREEQAVPRRNWLRSLVGREQTPQAPEETTVVSRLVVLGVGTEKGALDYDRTGRNGVAAEAGNIVRAAGELVTSGAMATLRKKFEGPSQTHLGMPAVQVVDGRLARPLSSVKEDSVLPDADRPVADIKDGRLDNMLRLVAFGRHVCINNRHAIAGEINTRMRTLEARGVFTPAQTEAVARRLETIATPQGAADVCERFMINAANVEQLLAEHDVPRPATAVAVAPVAAGNGGSLLGWVPGLGKLRAG